MFALACEEAAKFIRPVVVSWRTIGGDVKNGIGSCVIVNADGWIVTAGHVMQVARQAVDHHAEIEQYQQQLRDININHAGNDNKRRVAIKALDRTINKDLPQNVSYWWGEDGVQTNNFSQYVASDVAICQLEGLTAPAAYPTFKKADDVKFGTSLVRVGYPLVEAAAKWNTVTSNFDLDSSAICLFPNEGIYTRTIDRGIDPDGIPIKFLETSTPGLKGQSGGPILDQNGHVCAIQAQTQHYPLGFSPELKDARGRVVVEHQVLNVGWGVHPETLETVFKRHAITANWA